MGHWRRTDRDIEAEAKEKSDVVAAARSSMDNRFVDAVWQNSVRARTDACYLAAIKVYEVLSNGLYGVMRIPVGAQPVADVMREEMNGLLASGLQDPFKAEFFGYKDDDDGFLSWSRPIHVSVFDKSTDEWAWSICKPSVLPLEIGTTSGSKSFSQIMHTGLARWPYDHDSILAFVHPAMLIGSDSPDFQSAVDESGENISELSNRDPWS